MNGPETGIHGNCVVCGAPVSRYSGDDDGFYCMNALCSYDDENADVNLSWFGPVRCDPEAWHPRRAA